MSVLWIFSRPGISSSLRLKLLAATNVLGLVYFLVLYSALLYLALFHIIPQKFGDYPESVLKHMVFTGYLAVNVIGNFLNVIRVDSSIRALNRFPKIKDKQFKLECSKCQRGVPRRAHHCSLCDICVLKRDHHCFFMNTCIGYFNQKYFFLFCLYATIGAVYCTILLAIHMHLNHKVVFTSMWTFIVLLPSTISGWWFRTVQPPPSTALLAVVGLFYATLIGFLLAAGIVFWQIYIISQGQTTHEAKHGITKFRKSMKENFLDVFGPYWYISFFIPVALPQKGNGTYSPRATGAASKTPTSRLKKKDQ